MKKFFVILLAFSMCFLLAAPISAAAGKLETIQSANGAYNNTVDVLIDSDGDGIPDSKEDPKDIDPTARVYSVCVIWESLDFMYSGKWDPISANYSGVWKTYSNDKWSIDNQQMIFVENRSNAFINVYASVDNASKNGVTTSLSANAAQGVRLPSAASAAMNHETNTGPMASFAVYVHGNPNVSQDFMIGTVTVRFAAE